jgi:hypothetical protein
MLLKAAVLVLAAAATADAQVQSRPTEPPLVTAANEAWFQLREPIQFAGELYYPAGAAVFFDGNVMARVGHYNGVPVYTDTTVEPYSIVLVPVRRGLLQPYERRRQGDLSGTTGSRTPSFPSGPTLDPAYAPAVGQAATSPTQPQVPIGAISSFTPAERAAVAEPAVANDSSRSADAFETRPATRRQDPPIVSVLRPENNDGLWVQFAGAKWVSAGPAVPLKSTEFRVVGQHAGFPVFVRGDREDTIYLPTRAGLVAPYRLK